MKPAVGACLGAARAGSAAADVWCAWVQAHAADVDALSEALLSTAERERLGSYKSRAAATRFVVTRALVRSVLAPQLRCAPADIPITVTDLGKPVVAGDVHFNVSHSGDLVLLAVSGERAVGIDVERERPIAKARALIDRWLNEAERRDVTRWMDEGASESTAFLRVWSLKEARLKALGVGIAGAPESGAEALLAISLDDLLTNLGDGDSYIGAVAFA